MQSVAIRFAAALAAVSFSLVDRPVLAQDAIPPEMLYRTVPVIAGDQQGTGFFIDSQEKLYLVTARHVVNALPTCNTKVQAWLTDQWKFLTVTRVLLPDSDANVAALETEWK
jgi:S1-C subfamily serine protease